MRFKEYLSEERITLDFTREDEEEFARRLAEKFQRDASFSFFEDAVVIDANPKVMKTIKDIIKKTSKKLKGLYISEGLNEGNVEFYNNPQDRKPSDILDVKDVPALLRAVGHGAKKISLESEGQRDRKALNKALKSGKTVYVAFNPFHLDIAGIYEILWHTDKKKFVKTYGDLAAEV
jgi:hypothetical protein